MLLKKIKAYRMAKVSDYEFHRFMELKHLNVNAAADYFHTTTKKILKWMNGKHIPYKVREEVYMTLAVFIRGGNA